MQPGERQRCEKDSQTVGAADELEGKGKLQHVQMYTEKKENFSSDSSEEKKYFVPELETSAQIAINYTWIFAVPRG